MAQVRAEVASGVLRGSDVGDFAGYSHGVRSSYELLLETLNGVVVFNLFLSLLRDLIELFGRHLEVRVTGRARNPWVGRLDLLHCRCMNALPRDINRHLLRLVDDARDRNGAVLVDIGVRDVPKRSLVLLGVVSDSGWQVLFLPLGLDWLELSDGVLSIAHHLFDVGLAEAGASGVSLRLDLV